MLSIKINHSLSGKRMTIEKKRDLTTSSDHRCLCLLTESHRSGNKGNAVHCTKYFSTVLTLLVLFHARIFMSWKANWPFFANHYSMCWPVVCLPILSFVNCPTYPSLLLFIASLYNWMSLEPNNKKIEYSSVLYLVLFLVIITELSHERLYLFIQSVFISLP